MPNATERALNIRTIEAHEQTTTLHIVELVPSHVPRESDPHYHAFHQARERLKRQGLLKCWIGNADCAGQIELHHSHIEFCLITGIDVQKVDEAFGLHLSDEEFQAWVEGPANLLALCKVHHTGYLGVHVLPGPLWEPQKYMREGISAPAHLVRRKS